VLPEAVERAKKKGGRGSLAACFASKVQEHKVGVPPVGSTLREQSGLVGRDTLYDVSCVPVSKRILKKGGPPGVFLVTSLYSQKALTQTALYICLYV